jgi:hypothetical protein
MTVKDRDDYWNCVKKCLVRFHGWSRQKAAANVRVKRPLFDTTNDMIYHVEPFNLAEDIAGQKIYISTEDYRKFYLKEICDFDAHFED